MKEVGKQDIDSVIIKHNHNHKLFNTMIIYKYEKINKNTFIKERRWM